METSSVDFAHTVRKRFGCFQRTEIPNNRASELRADHCDLIALGPGGCDFIGDHPPSMAWAGIGAYAADRVATATRIIVEIVRKQAGQIGFAVHPRRWVVERFLAWLGRNRRLAKDFEGTLESATAFLYAASVLLLTRRLARSA